ncbi:head-tail adaptor protein [Phyllobacterium salinisoli]|uniref:Head-tail adaptor protein n=1 Tax=Phyllobacterium salinisoli TaxID=1899321 RepID=A0A368K913_9HYPH|nr:phage head closure protein [Phyllobacterium salinisoli]RCS25837.1 head-tail adaptor protein [Phyllobacterium salinisoli]
MRAGKLDRVIDLQRGTYVTDGYGNPIYTWTTYATMRAQIIQASTEEFMRTWGASGESAIIFRTRFIDGIGLADRVIYDGRMHDIKEVKEIGRRRGLEIRTARTGA